MPFSSRVKKSPPSTYREKIFYSKPNYIYATLPSRLPSSTAPSHPLNTITYHPVSHSTSHNSTPHKNIPYPPRPACRPGTSRPCRRPPIHPSHTSATSLAKHRERQGGLTSQMTRWRHGSRTVFEMLSKQMMHAALIVIGDAGGGGGGGSGGGGGVGGKTGAAAGRPRISAGGARRRSRP